MKRLRFLPAPVLTALVTILLCAQWWLGVSATFGICTTADELAHVAGGLSYWKYDDYRLQPENGNLPQRLAALPWLLSDANQDLIDRAAWEKSNVWLLGHRLFYESGNNTDYLLALSRGVMALTGVILGLIIFIWSRRLWGDGGGLLSLSLYVLCPNILANAPLATSDMTSSLCLLVATGAYWSHLNKISWGTSALSILLMALTCVAKFSFGLLIPIFGLLILVRFFSPEPMVVDFGQPLTLKSRKDKYSALLWSVIAHVVVAWAVIWWSFGFRYSAIGAGMPAQKDFFAPWELVMPAHGFWHFFFAFTRNWHLFPEAFLQGFAYVLYAAAERGAFLNGEYSNTGWVSFFPYAFWVKTPWPQLAAFAGGLVAVGLALRRKTLTGFVAAAKPWCYRVAPLLILFVVYWIVSLGIHLNIGLRHILPTYPVLFIGAGCLARVGAPRWMKAGAVACVIFAATTIAGIYPHYLAFFNGFAGGPENGWRHLVDSSLDWGQDLPELSKLLKTMSQPNEKVYLCYFGSGEPAYEGIKAAEFAPIYNFDRPRRWFNLEAGVYCISATMLQDVYSGWRGAWSLDKERNYQALQNVFKSPPRSHTPEESVKLASQRYDLDRLRFSRLSQYLRLRRPDATVGYTIFVFRLSQREVEIAEHGKLSELASLMGEVNKQNVRP